MLQLEKPWLCGFALLVATLAGAAPAAEYPDKSIRLIVPAATGGGADFVARIVGSKLTEFMGQAVVVDNRAGASGTIAAEVRPRRQPMVIPC